MRAGVVAVLMIACGGGTVAPPPARPDPVASTPVPEPEPAPTESRQPEPAPVAAATPPVAPVVPLRDRLHDDDGPLPGMPGWNLKRVADATVCGGTKVVVSRGRRKLDADQAALAKLYEVQFPADLDFDPAVKAKKEASLERFNAYVEQMKKVASEANDRYAKAARDSTGDASVRAAAAARIAQVSLRFAAALARAPIPRNARTGEFAKDMVEAYCSAMEEVAEPLAARAQEALDACSKSGASGWWVTLCSPAAH